ncbi:hypothetical protein [Winogradskyella aurantia]|uniref:Lipoprotein n=1 Tax=Winogradskyella aurantia TaxID=1915063 RepID=A0A265V051_9FLAO|nr:hypothetical protein [Winogradskyella aurantia]OZV70948.1 hypothetical protein CA834_02205 [Winogradskyella aurantia]
MKVIMSILALVVVVASCNSVKRHSSKSDTPSSMSNEDITKGNDTINNKVALAYRASTRGFFEYIYISEEDIKITQDRNFEQIQKYPNTKADWDSLSKLLGEVDEDAFQNLVAPTDKRHYDAAPHASLTIIHGTKEITTPTFDHGYPPKEIEALVTKILSIKESVSKQ